MLGADAAEGRSAGALDYGYYRRAVLTLSFAFLAIFAGYNAAQGLQSSLNGELGFINLATLYATFALCCIMAPGLIQRLEELGVSPRAMLLVSALVYAVMVLVNMRPVPAEGAPGYLASAATTICLSFLVGLAAPVLWTVQNVYVARCALHAARCGGVNGGDPQDTAGSDSRMTSAFNGAFFFFFQFSGALGMGISSLVLVLDRQGSSRIMLFAVLGAVSLVGALGMLAVPAVLPVPREVEREAEREEGAEEEERERERGRRCSQTLALVGQERRMSLLVPLIYSNGCFLAFFFGDFPKLFVSATLGPAFAGPVLLVFYLCNSAASALWGWLLLRGSLRVWVALLVAFVLQIGVLLVLLTSSLGWLPLFKAHYEFLPGASDVEKEWVSNGTGKPQPWEYAVPLACVALAATGDAAFESQPPAILQTFFKDERLVPAMANYKLWQSLGFATSFLLGAAVPSAAARLAFLTVLFVVAFAALTFLDRRVASLSGEDRILQSRLIAERS